MKYRYRYKGYTATIWYYQRQELYRVKIKRGLRHICNFHQAGGTLEEVKCEIRCEVDGRRKGM